MKSHLSLKLHLLIHSHRLWKGLAKLLFSQPLVRHYLSFTQRIGKALARRMEREASKPFQVRVAVFRSK